MGKIECKCLDSDILIDFLRGKKKAVSYIDIIKNNFRIVTAVVNAFELYYTAYKYNRDIEKIDEFMQSIEILPFTLTEAKKAAEIKAKLESEGEMIGLKDVLISSIAISNSCDIVTRNVKHFSKILGVKVENWR
ncbi:type II toxin-antitoxin system VapC family toxin [Saccharolobus shibatae]|uniref:VapC toxin protein n=2 Tax=Saccharolobus shibatae TaxID=2286 RepID=A0A8F5BPI8_SACSH|nr:type II toxin-antitoxin system VapC family toxin [Saccharolobus shibatae]QXJ29103.1 VapC toxin protein [Saccharolobus shibatae B12]QXJ32342.1 VapC toxin protein [Saccharolobus shibatae]